MFIEQNVDAALGGRLDRWLDAYILPGDIYIPPVQEIDFRELDVRGRLLGPSVTIVNEVPRQVFFPFIDLRQDFQREIELSVHEVR